MGDVWSNLLTVGIILALIVIVYLKFSKKTIREFITELKET